MSMALNWIDFACKYTFCLRCCQFSAFCGYRTFMTPWILPAGQFLPLFLKQCSCQALPCLWVLTSHREEHLWQGGLAQHTVSTQDAPPDLLTGAGSFHELHLTLWGLLVLPRRKLLLHLQWVLLAWEQAQPRNQSLPAHLGAVAMVPRRRVLKDYVGIDRASAPELHGSALQGNRCHIPTS